eukprot:1148178-Prymnesium_polylepis.1
MVVLPNDDLIEDMLSRVDGRLYSLLESGDDAVPFEKVRKRIGAVSKLEDCTTRTIVDALSH